MNHDMGVGGGVEMGIQTIKQLQKLWLTEGYNEFSSLIPCTLWNIVVSYNV